MVFFSSKEQKQKEKLQRLYHEYSELMYSAALSYLHDPSRAEDAVHEAFLKIEKRIDEINEKERHKTASLFVLIVKRVAIDWLRRKKKERNLIEYYSKEESYTKFSEMEGIDEDFLEAFHKLPYNYREILKLKYIQEFSNREIADWLNIREDNVRQRLSRARKKFKELLEEGGYGEEH